MSTNNRRIRSYTAYLLLYTISTVESGSYNLKPRTFEDVEISNNFITTPSPSITITETPSVIITETPSITPTRTPSISPSKKLTSKSKKVKPSASPSVSAAPSVSSKPSYYPSVSHAPSVTSLPSDVPSVSLEPSVSFKPTKYSKKKHGPKKCEEVERYLGEKRKVVKPRGLHDTKKKDSKSKKSKKSKKDKADGASACVPSFVPSFAPNTNGVIVSTNAPVIEQSENPSLQPTEIIAPACTAFQNGSVLTSLNSETVEFLYEVETEEDADVTKVLTSVEDGIFNELGNSILCGTGNYSIIGISTTPVDTVQEDNVSNCTNLCKIINGGLTIYMDDDNGRMRHLDEVSAGDDSMSSETTTVLSFIQSSMNEGSYNDESIGLINVKYLGIPSDVNNPDAPSNIENAVEEDDDSISGIGLSIVILGAALVAILAFLAYRRHRRDGDNYDDFDDQSFDDKLDFDTVDSASCSPKRRIAHVVGEQDSIYGGEAFGTHSMSQSPQDDGVETFISPNAQNLERAHSAINVHKCSSAMCPICNNRKNGPKFISTNTLSHSMSEGSPSPTRSGVHLMRPYPTEDTVDL